MFSSNYINSADKIILIEGDKNWVEVLRYTFQDEIDTGKLVLIDKFLSDNNDDGFISLNRIYEDYCENANNVLIKMDIEGYEERALQAADKLICNMDLIEIIACSYHHQLAEEKIQKILTGYGLESVASKGYIYLFPEYEKTIFHEYDSEGVVPSLRRALVVGKKENNDGESL